MLMSVAPRELSVLKIRAQTGPSLAQDVMFGPLSGSTMTAGAVLGVPVGAALVNFRVWTGNDLTR